MHFTDDDCLPHCCAAADTPDQDCRSSGPPTSTSSCRPLPLSPAPLRSPPHHVTAPVLSFERVWSSSWCKSHVFLVHDKESNKDIFDGKWRGPHQVKVQNRHRQSFLWSHFGEFIFSQGQNPVKSKEQSLTLLQRPRLKHSRSRRANRFKYKTLTSRPIKTLRWHTVVLARHWCSLWQWYQGTVDRYTSR